jgi:hypothetical protein
MVLAQVPIPHLVDLRPWRPPSHLSADKPDEFYSVQSPVSLLSGNGGSSSLYISKYIIEVLKTFYNNPSNPRQPMNLMLSAPTL